MKAEQLETVAQDIVADARGILAADESTPTIGKRFATIGVESTEDSRRAYRELLFTTSGVGEFVSGVILYDETIRQSSAGGASFVEVLQGQNIHPGIKVDTGAKDLAGSPDEKVTEGLDGLRDRVAEYRELGATFAKWRAVITIGDGIPSRYCIEANAHALARYARLCQEGGLVPIVEPEVLMDGAHDIDRSDDVTTSTLATVFHVLHEHGVHLEGMLLKPSMVISGADCPVQADIEEVAARTVRCLSRTVPAAVPGIVFLSGGQSDALATQHLNAMNGLSGAHPWKLSFSYGRALQALALQRWSGAPGNVAAAQQALYHRAKFNSAACRGDYSADMERALEAA